MLYLNNDLVYKVNSEWNVLIFVRKLHYTGDSHYLVLFSIRTIPGIALIETVLTGDPLYQKMSITNNEKVQYKQNVRHVRNVPG